ncbi:MAG: hypothetical protein LQ348_005102 [Seirophora lacunosa]|nr:MAG: hypothetical protein LQ348_005102 [Seirophora lacunosa]
MSSLQQCLRPPLRFVRSGTSAAAAAHCRFYSIAQILKRTEARANNLTVNSEESHQTRREALVSSGRELYPRIRHDGTPTMPCKSFLESYKYLTPGDTVEATELSLQGMSRSEAHYYTPLTAIGRVRFTRISGSKLAFIDLAQGIDKTHNPEFTTCEFYAAYEGLPSLMTTTERLLTRLATATNELIKGPLSSLPVCDIDFASPFRRLDFIKEIESAMNYRLPDLAHKDSEAELLKIFTERNIRIPERATLPKLLDRLSAEYLEPRCQSPTWIIHHPECLAPLSKSFVDPESQQRVSARAELFIGGKELVNTYEEENSPFEQRRKFQEQAKYRDDTSRMEIDESYLEALEWGLPPTGGWGCGIDRLVMLLSGADRINDVLPFGNLRNVVSLGSVRRDTAGNIACLCVTWSWRECSCGRSGNTSADALTPEYKACGPNIRCRQLGQGIVDGGSGITSNASLRRTASGDPEASIGEAHDSKGGGRRSITLESLED